MAAVAGHKATAPKGYSAYVASKHGVRGLAKQIASELAPYSIRSNSISPGTIVTDMLESLMDDADEKQRFEGGSMLKRLGQVDELNGTVLLLMSDAGSRMTGDDILVDAGAAS